jgi:hypothetical protein
MRTTGDVVPSAATALGNVARNHGDEFGRIEPIIRGDKLIRLDLNKDEARDKVRAVSTSQHLRF